MCALVTPQTNTTLEEIAAALREHDNYVIAGHMSPDGDCLGSQLALMWALRSIGKQAQCVFEADVHSVPLALQFLPGIEEFVPARDVASASSFVALDVPSYERMGKHPARLHASASFTVTIDHHAYPERISQLSYVDPAAASTTTLVWRLAQCLGAETAPHVASCAYTGLVTDTGRFQFQNSDAAAFRAAAEMVEAGADVAFIATQIYQNRSLASIQLENIAAEHMELLLDGRLAFSWVSLADFARCGASKPDADALIEMLRSISGVRVACLLRETEESVRGSLRAKDNTNVATFAAQHNGGGHDAAAGMTVFAELSQAIETIREELSGYCLRVWGE